MFSESVVGFSNPVRPSLNPDANPALAQDRAQASSDQVADDRAAARYSGAATTGTEAKQATPATRTDTSNTAERRPDIGEPRGGEVSSRAAETRYARDPEVSRLIVESQMLAEEAATAEASEKSETDSGRPEVAGRAGETDASRDRRVEDKILKEEYALAVAAREAYEAAQELARARQESEAPGLRAEV